MGILIADAVIYEQIGNLEFTGSVITFNGKAEIIKNKFIDNNGNKQTAYVVVGRYDVFVNKDAYDNEKEPIIIDVYHAIPATAEQLNGNIITLLYDSIKCNYPSAVDI